jgi:hypothetical protein
LIDGHIKKFFFKTREGLTLLSPDRPTYLGASFLLFLIGVSFFEADAV